MRSASNAPSVVHISHNYHVTGGSDNYYFELERLLNNHGHQIIPFCAKSSHNRPSPFEEYFPDSIDSQNASVFDAAKFVYSREAKQKLGRLLDDKPVDIAHLHIYYGKLTSSILGELKKRNIPIVQTLHEYKIMCPVYTCISNGKICEACQGKEFWHCTLKRCNRGSLIRSFASTIESYTSKWLGATEHVDHFIGVSEFLTKKMLQIGIPENKIRTIHNFVDCSRFEPATEPGRYILYFGRLERVKGIYTLLDAIEQLPSVNCIIAGSGPEDGPLRESIVSRGLSNVELVGFKSGKALHELIRGSMCTVLPSEWYENCPMSILESFALGRPVIGTNIGGIPELISNSEDGILIDVANANDLAAAIDQIATAPGRAVQMGSAGRMKVMHDFSADKHYAKIQDVYSKVLS